MKQIDCEDCPLSWEDRGCEGECYDCGCMIYGDLYEGSKAICHFPEFFKNWIAKRINRKIDKQQAHQYDGIGEWYKEECRKDRLFQQALMEEIFTDRYDGQRYLCWKDESGKLHEYHFDTEYFREWLDLARMRYEELLKEDNYGKDGD